MSYYTKKMANDPFWKTKKGFCRCGVKATYVNSWKTPYEDDYELACDKHKSGKESPQNVQER